MSATDDRQRESGTPKAQRAALEAALRVLDPGLQTEARFDWMAVPSADGREGVLDEIWRVLRDYRGHEEFATVGFQPRCDYYLPALSLLVEYDERQHFTMPRGLSLAHYPSDMSFGFDTHKWMSICEQIAACDKSPDYRDEQRAYYDSVRDIAAAQHGTRLVRIRHGEHDWSNQDVAASLALMLIESGR